MWCNRLFQTKKRTPTWLCRVCAMVLVLLTPGTLRANPSGSQVVSGQATFVTNGNTLNITTSDQVSINWQTFSIGAGETTQFFQPSASSLAVNRVMTGNPSALYGTLRANGQIMLINPNGMVVGAGGVIDTGGFIGSTLNVPDEQIFGNGDWEFRGGNENVSIQNFGTIKANGGDVVLISREVTNAGSIEANQGRVALAGGTEVLLARKDDATRGIYVRPEAGAGSITNSGSIAAMEIEMEAAGGNPYAFAVNNSGTVRAVGFDKSGGRVRLLGHEGLIKLAGEIKAGIKDKASDVVDKVGGLIEVTAPEILVVEGTTLDARGLLGGGQIYIGGNFQGKGPLPNAERVIVEFGAKLFADAIEDGAGGTIIIWSDDHTGFGGNISARGAGSGDAGFAEVSGKKTLVYRGTADLTADNGTLGTLLLDPDDIVIANAATSADDAQLADNEVLAGDGTGTFTISNTAIVASLLTANTQLLANNTIAVNGSIVTNTNNSLTLNAGTTLTTATNVDVNLSNLGTGTGGITFIAGTSITIGNNGVIQSGTGGITFRTESISFGNSSSSVTTTGTLALEPFNAATTVGVNGGAGTLQINTAANYTAGAFRIGRTDGTGLVTVNVSTFTNPVEFAGGSIAIDGALAGTDVTLSADAVAIAANVSGSGTLTIHPNTDATTIGIGAGATGGLNLDATELGFLQDGFTSIVIGKSTGTGAVDLNAFTFLDPVTIAGGSSLTGPDAVTTYSITGADTGTLTGFGETLTFQNIGTLTGGSGVDTFNFTTGTSALSGNLDTGAGATNSINFTSDALDLTGTIITGNLTGNGTTDTLSYAGQSETISIDLNAAARPGIAGTITGIEAYTGGSGTGDTFTGLDAGGTWTINAVNAGTFGTVAFSGFENLTGGSGADTFNFTTNTGSITGTLTTGNGTNSVNVTDDAFDLTAGDIIGGNLVGGTGTDTLDFSVQSEAITINFQTGTGTGLGGAATLVNIVNGGSNTGDSIVGSNTATTYNINAANAGSTTGGTIISFTSFENITGGTGSDTFNFTTAAGAISGNLTTGSGVNAINFTDDTFDVTGGNIIGGILTGGGTDTLSYANQTEAVAVNLQAGTATGIGGTFSSVETFTGGNGSDTLTGTNASTTYTINAANAGTAGSINFSSFENITAGLFGDTFNFTTANGSISGNLDTGNGTNAINFTDDAFDLTGNMIGGNLTGGGTDTLSYAGQTEAVAVNLQAGTASGIGGTFTSVETFAGGNGSDTLTGSDTATTYTISGANSGTTTGGSTVTFSSFENLTGGSGVDTFNFTTGTSALSGNLDTGAGASNSVNFSSDALDLTGTVITGNLTGNGTTDTLSYAGQTETISIDLNAAPRPGIAGTVSGIESFVGGSGTGDTFTGLNAGGTWTINAVNAGTFGAIAFSGFENLTGGSGVDTFNFTTNAGSITGNLNTGVGVTNAINFTDDAFNIAGGNIIGGTLTGGGTVDTLSYANQTEAASVDLQNSTATAIGGTFSSIEAFTGGNGSDTLTGPNVVTTWSINAANAGSVSGVNFSSFENLTGGTNNDTFNFTTAAGSISGNLVTGTGTNAINFTDDNFVLPGNLIGGNLVAGGTTDTLSYAGQSESVTVDLDTTVAGGTSGVAGTTTGVETYIGGNGTDTILAGDTATTFNITSADGGTTTGGSVITFSSFGNITGGTGGDTFTFTSPGSLSGNLTTGSGTNAINFTDDTYVFPGTIISGNLTGGGTDTLSYAGQTEAVAVNLQAATASGIGGTFSSVETFTGGNGSDTLTGSNTGTTYTINAANAGTAGSVSFSSFENITGGSGGDTFNFTTASGSISGNLTTGSGTNFINFTDDAFNLSGDIIGGNLTGGGTDTLSFANQSENIEFRIGSIGTSGVDGLITSIETLIGGNGTNDQIRTTGGATFNITGTNSGNVSGTTFSAIETLVGDAGDDTFNFTSVVGSLTGSVGTGFGTDVINFTDDASDLTGNLIGGNLSALGTATLNYTNQTEAVSVDLQAGTASGIGGTVNGVDTYNGGNGSDTLTGTNTATTWSINAANAGTVGAIAFTSFENLTGGTNNDTFNFTTAAGSISGNLNTGAGATNAINFTDDTFVLTGDIVGGNLVAGGTTDTLSYAGQSESVTVDLDATAVGGTSGVAGTVSGVEIYTGGNGSDTLAGNDTATVFNITTNNAGNTTGGSTVTFSSFENITGGTSGDRFVFSDGISLSGTVNGGVGTDELDFSASSSAVIVNFSTGAVTNIFGGAAAGVSNVENATGTSLADTFTASTTQSNTFTGGDGNDTYNITFAGNAITATITEGAAGGSDIVNLTGTAGNDTFTLTTATTISDGTQSVAYGANVEDVNLDAAGGTGDTLAAFNQVNTWNITANNGGDLGIIDFINTENLTGGTNNDTFNIADTFGVTGTINGVSGTDAISWSGYSTAISVNLQTGAATGTGGFANIDTFTGGTVADTLTGANTANTWNITANNAGNIGGTINFASFENLNGGTAADTFNLADTFGVTGTIDGVSGTDELNWSTYTSAVTVNLQSSTATGTGGFANMDRFTGGTVADTFTGTNTSTTYTITAAGTGSAGAISFASFETVNGGSATADIFVNGTGGDAIFNVTSTNAGSLTTTTPTQLIHFTGMENLTGEANASDSFVLSNGVGVTGGIGGGAGTGTNTLDYSNYTAANPVSINLQAGTATNVTGGFSAINSFVGGAGSDTLTGSDTATTYNISGADSGTTAGGSTVTFSSFENLTGGSGVDTFNFTTGTSALSGNLDTGAGASNSVNFSSDALNMTGTVITGNLTGNGTSDTLSYAGQTETISIDLNAGARPGIAGTITGIEAYTGGSGTGDTFTGLNAGGTWTINAVNAGTFGTVAFSGFENLTGGSGVDTFNFTTNAGSITGNLNTGVGVTNTINFTDDAFNIAGGNIIGGTLTGGGTVDTLSYAGQTEAASVNLPAGTATAIGGAFSGVESFTGGNGSDMLTGSDTGTTYTINAANAGTAGAVTFSSFENITAGSGNDTFNFTTAAGSISGNLNTGTGTNAINFTDDAFVLTGNMVGGNLTGGGTDTLSFAGQSEVITVDLQTTTNTTGVGGTVTSIESFVGGSNTGDSLTGANSDTIYAITGSNSGTAGSITFSAFENLTGGSGFDQFAFGNSGSLTGAVDGGAGTNDRIVGDSNGNDFSITGSNSGTLTGKTSGWSNIEVVFGGVGVDLFTFTNAGNLTGALNGQGGNDTLTGDADGNAFGITGANSGTLTGKASGWSNIENLTGGAGADAFAFATGGTLSGNMAGAAGLDTLDLGGQSVAVTVTLVGDKSITGYGDVTGTITDIENFNGTSAADTITVNPLNTTTFVTDNTRTIDGNNPTTATGDTLNYQSAGGTVTFSSATITEAGFGDVSYQEIETLNFNGAGGFAIAGTAGNDTLTLSTVTVDEIDFAFTGGASGRLAGLTASLLTWNAAAGDDTLIVDGSSGNALITGGIAYNGQTNTSTNPGDGLKVIGDLGTDSNDTGVYTPDLDTAGSGVFSFNGVSITFTGLEPVDATGFTTITVSPGGAADALAVNSGTAFYSADAALRVSGSTTDTPMTGTTNIETIALFNNTNVIINTSASDGDDTVTVNATGGTTHNNTNFTVTTGAGADVINLNGAISFTGTSTFNDAVTVASATNLTSSTAFFNDTLNGGNTLTVTGNGDFDAAVGGTTALTSLQVTGTSTFNTGASAVSTTGNQTYTGGVVIGNGVTTQFNTTGGGNFSANSIAGVAGGAASNVTFNTAGTVGVTVNTGTDIGTLTIVDSTGATFGGSVDATTVTLTDTTGTIAFQGNLTATTLSTAAQTYVVSMIGANNTITNAVTFSNTGGLIFGDQTTDTSTFNGGVNTGTNAVSLIGTVATSNDAINMSGSTVTLVGTSTLDSNATTGTGSITIGQIVGGTNTLVLNAGTTADITATNAANVIGNLTVTANDVALTENDAITQGGDWTVTGTATLNAGANNITLNSAGNNFTTVQLTGANVALTDISGIDLGATTVSGTLGITAGGGVTDSGTVTVTGATTITATGNTITLDEAASNYSTVNLMGSDVAIADINAIQLGDVDAATLGVTTTNGAITQNATGVVVTGDTSFTAGGSSAITLNTSAANNFGGAVTLQGGAVNIADINAIQLGDVDAATLGVTTTNGAITQNTTGIIISGISSFTAGGGNGITLNTSSANDFDGAVNVSGTDVSLRDANALLLGTTVSTSNLTLQAGSTISVPNALNVGAGAGTLTVVNSAGTTFGNTVTAGTVVLTDTTGTIAFQGNLTVNTALTTAAQGYTVSITGASNTIAGDTTFINTGGVVIGNNVADSTTFINGLDTTAVTGGTSVAGTVQTTNTQMDLGATTVTTNSTINSGTAALNLASTLTGGANDVTLSGDEIDLNGGANSVAGTGNLTLAPGAAAATIGVAGGTGTLDLSAADLAALADGFTTITIGDSAAGIGAVDVDAVTFADDIFIVGGSIAVTGLNAGTNRATLTARTGSITDGDAGTADADVTAASAALIAVTGVGTTANPLETAVTTLAAQTTGAGDIAITNTGGVTLGTVSTIVGLSTNNGNITLVDAGNIVLGADVLARSNGNVSVQSTGGSITVGALVRSVSGTTGSAADGAGEITFTADSMDLGTTADVIGASGDLRLVSQTASTTIGIGTGTTGALQFSDAELGAINNGFNSIIIGRADGTGAIDLETFAFDDPVTIAGGASLTGPDAGNTYTINTTDGGTISGFTSTLAFANIGTLTGGTGNDTFNFTTVNGSLSGNLNTGAGTNAINFTDNTFVIGGGVNGGNLVAGTVTGGGTDTLNYTTQAEAIALDLNAFTITGVGSTFTSIETFNSGSATTDSITGSNTATIFNINTANAGTTTGGSVIAFSSFEAITGGSSGDTFNFADAGSLTGALSGGGGTDTLVGDTNGNAFTITGNNTGTLTGKTSGWSAIENLTGGTGVDTFAFNDGAIALSGNIDSAGGSDTLDLSARTTGVTVSLTSAGAITGSGLAANITNTENFTGTTAMDTVNVQALAATTRTLNAGAPATDVLNFDAQNVATSFTTTTIGSGGNQITYSNFEVMNFSNLTGLTTLTGTAAADTLTLTTVDGNTVNYAFTGGISGQLDGGTSFQFDGANGGDLLIVDGSGAGALLSGGITYNGQNPVAATGDGLKVIGDSTNDIAIYTPDATTTGNGVITLNGVGITFTGLEPVDITGMTTVTVSPGGAADVLTVANGFDFFNGGGTNALRVSGTTGGVTIETAALYNNTNVIVDTSGVDGNDTVNISNAANTSGTTNFTVTTGTGTDVTNLNGDVAFAGGIVTLNDAVAIGASVNVTGTTVNFNDTINGAHALTVTGNGVFNGLVGGSTSLASLNVTGTSTINTTGISTTGTQTYSGAVTLGANLNLDANGNLVSFGSTVRSDGTNRSLTISNNSHASFGGVVGGGGAGTELSSLSVAGTSAINTTGITTTGTQTYTGAAVIGSDTTLTGTTVDFGNTVNSDTGMNRDLAITGNASFANTVGVTDRLDVLSVSGTTAANGGDIRTTGNQTYTGLMTLGANQALDSGTGTITSTNGIAGATRTLNLQNNGGTGDVTVNGALTVNTLTTNNQAYAVTLNGGATVTTDTNFTNTGGLTLDNGSTFAGGLNTGTNAVSVAGTVATTNTQMDLGATTMTAATTLTSGSGAINIGSITDGAGSFALSLQDNTAASTGTVTFLGDATFGTLTTFGAPANYAVIFQGTTTTVDTDTNFANTGGLTLGNGAGDTTTFSGGLSTGTNAVSVAGTVATANTQMDITNVTQTTDSTYSSGAGGGAINITTLNGGGNAVTVNSGTGNSTLSGALTNSTTLGITANNIFQNVGASWTATTIDLTSTADAGTVGTPLNFAATNLVFNVGGNLYGFGTSGNLSGTTLAGDLSLTLNNNVTQAAGAAGAINVGGNFILDVGTNTVTLTNALNQFGGIGVTASQAQVTEMGDSNLLTSNVTGKYSLISTGEVTQTGGVSGGQFAVNTTGGGVNLSGANAVGTLGITPAAAPFTTQVNSSSTGAFTFNNNGALTVLGVSSGGGAVLIRSSGQYTMNGAINAGAGTVAIGSSAGEFQYASGTVTGATGVTGGVVIYSGTVLGTNEGGLTNYLQYGASFGDAGGLANIGLLVRETNPIGIPPIVITNPVVVPVDIPNVVIPNFSLTSIDLDLDDFLEGFLEGDLGKIDIGVINIGDGDFQVSEELLAKLKEELSTEAKQGLLDAMRSLLEGGIDIREADLPPGLIYLENSRGESVVIPISLLFDYLGRLLSEEEKEELLDAVDTL